MRVVSRMTDPLFSAIRRRLPRSLMSTGMDFSALIAALALLILTTFLNRVEF